MKTLSKTLLCVCGLALFPLVLSAAKPEYKLPKYTVQDIAELPKPVEAPIPVMLSGLAGASFDLKFTVDEQGRATHIRTAKPLFCLGLFNDKERDFAVQMMQVVPCWKFAPALDANGNAVSVKVRMPVKVIKRAGEPLAVVSLMLDTPTTDKS